MLSRDLGEGGNPVILPFIFVLPQLPLTSLVVNPRSIWIRLCRLKLNRVFPFFGREHCASSPRPVSEPLPDSFLCKHPLSSLNLPVALTRAGLLSSDLSTLSPFASPLDFVAGQPRPRSSFSDLSITLVGPQVCSRPL